MCAVVCGGVQPSPYRPEVSQSVRQGMDAWISITSVVWSRAVPEMRKRVSPTACTTNGVSERLALPERRSKVTALFGNQITASA